MNLKFSAPEQWTSIPVLVKIYKLLINELSNQIECNMSARSTKGDNDDDEVSNFFEKSQEQLFGKKVNNWPVIVHIYPCFELRVFLRIFFIPFPLFF